MKLQSLIAFFCTALVLSPKTINAEQARPEAEISVKTVYDSEKGFSDRMAAGNRQYRVVLLNFRENEKTVFSIYTPYSAAGRIKTQGLLKEIKNPAAHYPGAAVFMEKTRIIPDTSFAENGNTGIKLDAGNLFSIFAERGESERNTLEWQGLYTGLKAGRNTELTFAASEYREKDDSEKDFWYSERAAGYGRDMTNISLSGKTRYGVTGFSFAAAVTSADGRGHGLYARVSPFLVIRYLRVYLLAACTNEEYIKPNGNYPSTAFRKGVQVLLDPFPLVRIKVRYLTDQMHKKSSDSEYGGYTEEAGGTIGFDPFFLSSSVFLKNKNIYSDDILTRRLETGYSAGIKSPQGRIIFEQKRIYQDAEELSEQFRVEAGTRRKHIDLYILGKIKNEESAEKSAKARITLKRNKLSLFTEYTLASVIDKADNVKNYSAHSSGIEAKF